MEIKITNIIKEANEEIYKSLNINDMNDLKVKYLGKKGKITDILKQMSNLDVEDKKKVGALANKAKQEIEDKIKSKIQLLEKKELLEQLQNEKVDVTISKHEQNIGSIHPLNIVLNKIKSIFKDMGYSIKEGPEIELDYYNFEALNIPKNHPSRNIQDTFYVSEDVVLRTQTSPVQIREMEKTKPPIKIISSGKVFRTDSIDATHSPIFHQIEGLYIDKGISMSHLKSTLDIFCKKLFGEDTKIRFRPHHFPFTEPSAEIDIMCFKCDGKGCPLCKNEGWIEILGCGMVHSKVLTNCNIDPEIYSGFAFGLGLERIVMKMFNIDDLRVFFENDIRFLEQF